MLILVIVYSWLLVNGWHMSISHQKQFKLWTIFAAYKKREKKRMPMPWLRFQQGIPGLQVGCVDHRTMKHRGCLKKKFTTLLKIDFNPFFDWNGIYNGLDWLINTFLIIFWQDSVIFVDQLSKFWFLDGQSPLHFWWKKLGNAFFRKLECP